VRVRVSRTFQQTQFRFLALQVRGGRTGVTDRRGNAPAGNPRLLFRILHGSRVTFTEPDGDSATIDVTTPNGEVFLDLIQLVGNKPLVQAWITDPIPGFTTPVVGVRRGRLGDGLIVISEIIGLDKKEFTPLLSNTSFRVNTLTFSSNATGRF